MSKEVPGWANWAAQDADGQWWAYEAEPLQNHQGWYENEVGRYQKLRQYAARAEDWRQSLHRIECSAG